MLLAGLLCALCDETIQLFVVGRSSQVSDIWVDFSGILAVAVLLWAIRRFRGRRKNNNTPNKET